MEDRLREMINQDLEKSGLDQKILEKAHIKVFDGNSEILKQRLGFTSLDGQPLSQAFKLLEIPYFNGTGEIVLYRYKLYPSTKTKDGKDIKYLHPLGKPAIPYILPEIWEIKDKPNKPIWITEGEKKALKLIQSGGYAIALSGVWNFKAGKDSINQDEIDLWKELKDFNWNGRTVYLAFDMDWKNNPQVRQALWELALRLYGLGAVVKVATWNAGKGKGIDDYLAGQNKTKPVSDFDLSLNKDTSELAEFTTNATTLGVASLSKDTSELKGNTTMRHEYIYNLFELKDLKDFIKEEDIEAIIRALSIVELPYLKRETLYQVVAKKIGVAKKAIAIEVASRIGNKAEELIINPDEEQQALELLKSPNLIEKFLETCHKEYIGRDNELILVKLATVARLLKGGIGIILSGTSSVGKSVLIKTVMKTVYPLNTEITHFKLDNL